MTETPLASVDDVEAVLGRDLTPAETTKAVGALEKASGLFRARSGQLFTPGRSNVRLKVNGGVVQLPQRPVTEVVSVTDDDGRPLAHKVLGGNVIVQMLSHEFVQVDYKHGGDVPGLVRTTVAEVVARTLRVAPDAATGVTQRSKTNGPFSDSVTFAAWAVGGQVMLSPDDIATAQLFRTRRTGSVIVQSSR